MKTIGSPNKLPINHADGWLCLAEYGEHRHERGLQRFHIQQARQLANDFHSLRSRLARKFLGCPIYIGHPDDPAWQARPGHNDTRAYAWIIDMEAREDGLYVLPRWSNAGHALLANTHYRFLSPRWQMRYLDRARRILEPVRLLSIGLTNQPNIPGPAISNQRIENSTTDTSQLLTNAVANGHILPHQLPAWRAGIEADPNRGRDELLALANQVPALHTASCLPDLACRNREAARPRPFLEVVRQRMRETGEDFATAWSHTKRTHPAA